MSRLLPPEWAPQRAVMLTWPRAGGDFAADHPAVECCFIELAVAISRHVTLWINVECDGPGLRQRLLRAGIPESRLQIREVPNDDVWARDHGPITVFEDGKPLHLDFRFNGWGGKFPSARDDAINGALAARGLLPAPLERIDFVLEGGAIDSDGCGTLLTTTRCLLAPTRNPQLDRAGIEARLRHTLGAQRILWLAHGDLLGDDTDGHIDTLARFCDPHTIAYQACDDPHDPHHAELAAMAGELAALRDAEGQPYRLVPLPLPPPILDRDGRRLPAGYANFLITNDAVLMPVYGDPADAEAQRRLAPLFPGRRIEPVDCRPLIRQGGSLHCVTMQIPDSSPPVNPA